MIKDSKLSGIILINKPEKLSSNNVVGRVKRILSVKKAGHTGTLDPFATGLLPVCINRGTKLSRYFLGKEKEYIGTISLGIETDTLDKTGEVVNKEEVPKLSDEKIKEVCKSFLGESLQTPPAYSALKHNGVPLYKHARNGVIIKKDPRKINIYSLEIENINLPDIKIRVKCSAGTYIRTLALDISKKLGTTGHLKQLERSACGNLNVKESINLEELEDIGKDNISKILINPEKALDFMDEIVVDDNLSGDILLGKKISINNIANLKNIIEDIPIKIMTKENRLISIVRKVENSDFFKYDVVFN